MRNLTVFMVCMVLPICLASQAQANGKSFGFGPVGKVADCVNPWALENCFFIDPILEERKSRANARKYYPAHAKASKRASARYVKQGYKKPSRTIKDYRVK